MVSLKDALAPRGDGEIKEMLAEVDLLSLIRNDTGEQGETGADTINFNRCPICGHKDCFRFYPATNTWSCFGASNDSGHEGGTALEYYKATHAADDKEAVAWLREQTGRQLSSRQKTAAVKNDKPRRFWPIVSTDLEHIPEGAPVLVEDLLSVGDKGIIAGASKSHKSWLALNLALSVATGGEWLGRRCRKGRVLYLNMEIRPDKILKRIKHVADAKGVNYAALDGLKRIDMRGYYDGIEVLAEIIREQVGEGEYSMIVLDPLYKAFNGDENSAYEVGMFTKAVDTICEDTGAAFVYVHHHSKGAKGEVASIDRASGSGVFGRDPDCICDVVRIEPPDEKDATLGEGERAYQLSFHLRDFVEPEPINVIYSGYLHRLDAEGVTADWKPRSMLGRNRGGKATAQLNKTKAALEDMRLTAVLAAAYYSQGVGRDGLLLKDAAALCGCDSRKLARAVEDSDLFTIEQASQRKRYVKAVTPPPPRDTPLDLPAN